MYQDYSTNEQYAPSGYGTIPATIDTQVFPIVPVETISIAFLAVVMSAGLLVYYKKHKHHLVTV
jgi:hypothetical protein